MPRKAITDRACVLNSDPALLYRGFRAAPAADLNSITLVIHEAEFS
jgi:hypothetical protein